MGSSRHRTTVRTAKQPPKLVRLLFPIPFALAGLFVVWLGIGDVLDGHASTDWPTVPGEVTESFVETHSDDDGTTYSAEVRYTYTVDGEPLRGDRVAFSVWNAGHAKARAIVDTYPVGRTVDVHYEPSDPTNAVLVPGAQLGSYGLVAFGTVFLTVGVVLFLVFRRRAAEDVETVEAETDEPSAA